MTLFNQHFSYRDFRELNGPLHERTLTYWNVLAARLAFIIVFEHVIFFIIYMINWLVPDVPKTIQDKIDHERFIDQLERWASKKTENHFKDTAVSSESLSKIINHPNGKIKYPYSNENSISSQRSRKRRGYVSPQPSKDEE